MNHLEMVRTEYFPSSFHTYRIPFKKTPYKFFPMLRVEILPVLGDNYIFMLVDDATQKCAVVDPALSEPVLSYLEKNNLHLGAIYNTHHHFDHVGGNLALQAQTGCKIYGYGPDAKRIPGITDLLLEGDQVLLGESSARVIFAPGHTRGHVLYYFESDQKCFVGDTLFSMGCGRLFEGTPEQMWESLQKVAHLPDEVQIYCAHDYTLANVKFAESLATSEKLMQYKEKCLGLRERGDPTIPATLGVEKLLNPFLAVASKEYRAQIGLADLSALEAFAEIRARKDRF